MALDSIQDVRVFRQVVDSGSISAAARALHDRKNRISQRLAALEKALGVRLAERSTRRLQLTEEGARFYDASAALIDAADLSVIAASAAGSAEGRVRLALRSALGGALFAAELCAILRRAPGLELQIVVVDEGADILAHGFDIAVQVGELPDSSFVAQRLGTASWVLAAAPSYLDERGRPRSPRDLARHTCVRKLGDRPETSWALVSRAGRRARARLGGNVECSDERVQSELILAGAGIGVRPADDVRRGERAGTLERVLRNWSFAPFPVWAVCPKGRQRAPRVALVIEALARVVARSS